MNLSEVFKDISKYSVKLYQSALKQDNRVATGKTLNSIRSESNTNGFTIYAPKHIKDLDRDWETEYLLIS